MPESGDRPRAVLAAGIAGAAGVPVPTGGSLTTAAGVVLGPLGLFAYLVYWYRRAEEGGGENDGGRPPATN